MFGHLRLYLYLCHCLAHQNRHVLVLWTGQDLTRDDLRVRALLWP